MSLNPHECRDDTQERSVAGRGFFVACRDASVPLDVVEEDLDDVTQLVEFLVIAAFLGSALAGWDDSLDLASLEFLQDRVAVVAPVSQACIAGNEVDESVCNGRFMLLTGCDQDLKRSAMYVHRDVDFRREAASRAAYAVFFGPPLPPAAS